MRAHSHFGCDDVVTIVVDGAGMVELGFRQFANL